MGTDQMNDTENTVSILEVEKTLSILIPIDFKLHLSTGFSLLSANVNVNFPILSAPRLRAEDSLQVTDSCVCTALCLLFNSGVSHWLLKGSASRYRALISAVTVT